MTCLPAKRGPKRLGLVIDLDICVGCHACAVNCKAWNSGGHSAPLTDHRPYGHNAWGVWFNRIHTFEAGEGRNTRTVYFPKSCLHCETPQCITACPTGASYKRAEDGIVLVNHEICIGCRLCASACPYGAREYDVDDGVMKKCTLCIDKIFNTHLEARDRLPACVSTCPAGARHFGDFSNPEATVSALVQARSGKDLMPEMGTNPTNKYLPPRPRLTKPGDTGAPAFLKPVVPVTGEGAAVSRFQPWADKAVSR